MYWIQLIEENLSKSMYPLYPVVKKGGVHVPRGSASPMILEVTWFGVDRLNVKFWVNGLGYSNSAWVRTL